MCGITGIFAFNTAGRVHLINLAKATHSLSHRGPDAFGTFLEENVGLGHRRLSVIDLSDEANQPFKDQTGRYILVYNGEIYNYKALRQSLEAKGQKFITDSDTEVLLYTYIHYGKTCLEKLNGFFSFAIFDQQEEALFIARDRFGIKPLYYFYDEDKFIFASEMQALMHYGIPKEIDVHALYTYFQLNYIPAPKTILQNTWTLMPGHYAVIRKKEININRYYQIDYDPEILNPQNLSYDKQKERLSKLIDDSVKKRMIADVPLGTFLSGGIDSSVITGIAKQYKEDLHTFSIGYTDEPYFDETEYANLVAKKFDTNHTVFSLSRKEIEGYLFQILDQIDQPFADSSAIPVYILSQKTKEYITVALSGDGADELFSGYNKHAAFLQAASSNGYNSLVKFLYPFSTVLPKSRNTGLTNKIRQVNRYGKALKLNEYERYWQWASLGSEKLAENLLAPQIREKLDREKYLLEKQGYLSALTGNNDFNRVLLNDMQLVLPNDMLRKVDLMSMAHGLEVRVPFLDHSIVDFVFSLPASSKINLQIRKRILQDTYRDILPNELYNRPKKGFEVPLLRWFKGSLKGLIKDDLLNDKFIKEQGIFDPKSVRKLRRKLYSLNPGDVHAQIWALIVFQWWWKKHFS